jgi:hypothetical protein
MDHRRQWGLHKEWLDGRDKEQALISAASFPNQQGQLSKVTNGIVPRARARAMVFFLCLLQDFADMAQATQAQAGQPFQEVDRNQCFHLWIPAGFYFPGGV